MMPKRGDAAAELRCSFCDRPRDQVGGMIRGMCQPPHIYICADCIDRFEAVGSEGAGADDLRCSFCGRSRPPVGKLMAGQNVHICDECVDLCHQILAEAPTKD